jgi:hypothetical protein
MSCIDEPHLSPSPAGGVLWIIAGMFVGLVAGALSADTNQVRVVHGALGGAAGGALAGIGAELTAWVLPLTRRVLRWLWRRKP